MRILLALLLLCFNADVILVSNLPARPDPASEPQDQVDRAGRRRQQTQSEGGNDSEQEKDDGFRQTRPRASRGNGTQGHHRPATEDA
jgi:hypothetical protein